MGWAAWWRQCEWMLSGFISSPVHDAARGSPGRGCAVGGRGRAVVGAARGGVTPACSIQGKHRRRRRTGAGADTRRSNCKELMFPSSFAHAFPYWHRRAHLHAWHDRLGYTSLPKGLSLCIDRGREGVWINGRLQRNNIHNVGFEAIFAALARSRVIEFIRVEVRPLAIEHIHEELRIRRQMLCGADEEQNSKFGPLACTAMEKLLGSSATLKHVVFMVHARRLQRQSAPAGVDLPSVPPPPNAGCAGER